MILQTQRLLLVPQGTEYLLSTHKYASDYENTVFMMHLPNKDLNETKSFLMEVEAEWKKDKPEFYEFAILLNQEHIGGVCVYLEKEETVGELGWIIRKDYWGNGYATEAAREVMNFAIQELNVKKIIAHCDSENMNSYHVMAKLGLSLTSITSGRKNKSSDEERKEMTYSLILS